jgi:hypothetical protein
VFEAKLAEGMPFVGAFLAATASALAFQREDPTFPLLLAVAAKARHDTSVRATLAAMYDRVEQETGAYYQLIMAILGRELRPPFTLTDLAGSFVAIYEGLALRQNVRHVVDTGHPVDDERPR